MAYIDQAGLIARFGEDELIALTDRDGTGLVDAQVIDQAIQDASDFIDGYLAGRVELPMAMVPPILKRIAADIARYFLYDEAPTEIVTQRFEDARAYLRDIQSGKVRLPPDAAGSEPVTDQQVEMVSTRPVWKRGEGFL